MSQGFDFHSITRFADDGSPLCRCNNPTRKLTSKTDLNPGRVFYKCNICDYFKWKDELPRNLPQQPRTSQSLAMIQGRMQATLTARRGTVFEGEALKQPQASAYSKQSAGESDVAIQADITSDLDGDDISYNLSGSNDDSFASVVDDHENLEVAAKETEVEAEAKMDEATYLLIQRSSRTTSVSSTRHLGAGMLLTPPRSSSKEAEDKLSRWDTEGSESPSQATRRGKQKAREFFESLSSAHESSSSSFIERLASAMDSSTTSSALEEDDGGKIMPENGSVPDMIKGVMNTMSSQMQIIFRKVEEQSILLQVKLSASERRVRVLEKRVMELEERTKELEAENATLSETFRVIQKVVLQSPPPTPERD